MKTSVIITVFTSLIVLALTNQSFAGAWTREKGSSYNRLALNYYYSNKNYIENSDRVAFPNDGWFQDVNLNYYVEYGLVDRTTLIGSFYYKWIRNQDSTIRMKTYGVGDVELAAKYKMLDASFGILSAQGLIKIPELYDEDDALPLGNGQYDFEVKLLYGRSLWPHVPGYCNFEVGYRLRAEEPADEFRFVAELGLNFGQHFYGRVKADGILGADNGKTVVDISGNPSITNDFDLIKLDMAFGYKITKSWAVEAACTPSIYGENTAAGTTYTLALVMETW